MRGDSSVAGEGRVICVPKFHSWGKCTMPLTNINSDWRSNASSGLCINYVGPLSCILECNNIHRLITWTVQEVYNGNCHHNI